ncbi:O-acyltransferase family protein [Theobroma cacao]|uniref:O-acyltransferase family protein n=1 Tax=Theobroma cacao TaxID=3641 RepID=A0A061FRI2_THECC|nr:O-acyltransferase family protein [Theobroma cacao]
MDIIDLRSGSHLGLKQIKVTREMEEGRSVSGEDNEPLSPMARMFHEPDSNVYIITIVGFKNPIEPNSFKANLVHTLLKHPRFSSVQVADENNGGELKWVQTEVELEKHVIVPKVDEEMASQGAADKFIEDYISNMSKTKISMSIPMWDCHILNLKTSDAESVLVLRVHHSLGDGTSLMSLLISCSRKLFDPLALPTFPAMKKKPIATTTWLCFWIKLWSFFLLIWNTLVDMLMCVATLYFYKDTPTPLKPPSRSVACTPKRIVRRTFSLDDVKLVKNATNTLIWLIRVYLKCFAIGPFVDRQRCRPSNHSSRLISLDISTVNMRHEAGKEWEDNLPNNIRLRATLFINLRSSPGIYALGEMLKKNSKAEWGNKIGYVLFPFTIALKDNPLEYIRDVKEAMDRKKASLEAKFRHLMATVFVRFYRTRLAKFPSTTMWFSNVAGPQDEITIFGNQVTYIAPSLYGQPVALTIHVVSYAKKMSMVLSVDDNIIPDPYQLCDDLEESLKLIKKSVISQ